MSSYVITDGSNFLHYNPRSEIYFASDKEIGACVFTQSNAENFIGAHLREYPGWFAFKVDDAIVKPATKSEQEYYDEFHPK